ncbi:MAG: hypothetical protein JO323_16455 [Acidobacteriia bacterium]|nr:hypothetical protein [Terriglobia bacterium]
MDGISLSRVSDATEGLTAGRKPANPKDAAQQFEALLLTQILHSVHQSGSSWLSSGEDSAGSSATDFAEQQLATSLARNGGLGLASLISSDLESRK